MMVPKGRVSYEPNTLNPDAPRESMERGFQTSKRETEGSTVRVRSASFSDHYSQARVFYRSITPPEQKHLADALTFELSKVESEAIRSRMLGHLLLIDKAWPMALLQNRNNYTHKNAVEFKVKSRSASLR